MMRHERETTPGRCFSPVLLSPFAVIRSQGASEGLGDRKGKGGVVAPRDS